MPKNQAAPFLRAKRPVTRVGTARRRPLPRWLFGHPFLAASTMAILATASLVAAALAIREDVTTNPSAVAPDVVFANGADYASINAAGFATLTLGSSGTSATLAVSGIPGAALVTLGNVMKLDNQDATQAYSVTLSRSGSVDADITSFQVVVRNGASTLLTWDALGATSSAFTAPANTALDVTISLTIATGTAPGAQGSFTMQFNLAPV
ncbi:MAG TPA: hypothetical protein VI796_00530 [Candidatus Thermoplasmatota archaeon]|nr:hypothetical protein [Candidatus Thermoplasmatota archaeon]